VEKVLSYLPDARAGTPVTSARKVGDKWEIKDGKGGVEVCDELVMATHTDLTKP
jgi:hypothetical protein